MSYPLSSEALAAIAAGRLHSAVLLDLYCRDDDGDPLTLRAWDQPGVLTYAADDTVDGEDTPVDYLSLAGRLQVDVAVRASATLAAEPLIITMDGSRVTDDDDITGAFASAQWHQLRARVRRILLDFETGASPTAPIWEWRGLMDHRQFVTNPGDPDQVILTCEGGLMRTKGRRMHTRTHADQQGRAAGDLFFQATPVMAGMAPSFGKLALGQSNPRNPRPIRITGTGFKGGSFL